MLCGWHYYSQCTDGQNPDVVLFQLIKRTNLDKKDAACLVVVHMLQHPRSRPTTKSTQDKTVKVAKRNFSPEPESKDGKLTL